MTSANIVIIGGGVLGANLAYQLALRGTQNVLVLESNAIGSGSSGRATGGLRQQFADAVDIRFAQESVRFYKEFTEAHDAPPSQSSIQRPRFYQYGYLFLVTEPANWQAMQRHVALQQSLGVPTQLLTPEEVLQRVPQLVVDDVIGASFCPSDGYSDPGAMAKALFFEAQQRGVVVREHAPVVGITVEHGRVQSVQTPLETIDTPLVINAAGAYGALVARLVGIRDLPIYPIRRQLYLTEPFADLPQNVPMVVDLKTGFHFRRRDGRVVLTIPLPISARDNALSQQLAREAFELPVDETLWPLLHAETQHRCPPLAQATIEHVWSGLYEMTPDEHPVLGKTEVNGFVCACGFSGHGFMHAPMAAKLLTELILDGASTTLDITPFSIERFRTGQLLETTRLL